MLRTVLRKITPNYFSQSKLNTSFQDWEYVKQINEGLKLKKVNEAFNTLVRSYLNNQILDIQTYHSVYNSLKHSDLPITYMQLLYKLYREHFQPNILLLDLMKSLRMAKNSSLKNMVKKDLKQLSVESPINQYQFLQSKEKNKKQNEDKIQIVGNVSSWPKLQIPPIMLQPIQNVKSTRKQTKKDIFSEKDLLSHNPKIKQLTQNQLQSLFSSIIQTNGKIIIHDLQIFYQQDEADSSDYDENQEYDDSQKIDLPEKEDNNQEQSNYLDYFGISKIKIGKIQIQKNDK